MTLRSLLSALACVLVAAACTADPSAPPPIAPPSPTPVPGGTLRFGVIGEPPTLDPFSPRATDLTFQLATPRLARPLRFEVRRDGTATAAGRRARYRLDGGSLELKRYERGLKLVLEPTATSTAYLDRVTVFFVESLEIALALLENGDLDAALLPSSVNLDERLDELGLEHAEELGFEAVHLRFNKDLLTTAQWVAIARRIDRTALLNGFVRDDGRWTNALRPAPCCRDGFFAHVAVPGGDPPDVFKLAVPAGDELLALMQRAIQLQLAERGIEVELITVPASILYGRWIHDGPAEAMLVRLVGAEGLSDPDPDEISFAAMPIAHVDTVLAWRAGVHGLDVEPTLLGPLWNAEGWWKEPEL